MGVHCCTQLPAAGAAPSNTHTNRVEYRSYYAHHSCTSYGSQFRVCCPWGSEKTCAGPGGVHARRRAGYTRWWFWTGWMFTVEEEDMGNYCGRSPGQDRVSTCSHAIRSPSCLPSLREASSAAECWSWLLLARGDAQVRERAYLASGAGAFFLPRAMRLWITSFAGHTE